MSKVLLIILFSLLNPNLSYALDGKTIFNRECIACHGIGTGRKVGPDLEGLSKRRSIDWIFKFINNSAQLIASGDPQAKKVFEEFGKMPMPPHSFTQAEIASIVDYINNPKAEEAAGQRGQPSI